MPFITWCPPQWPASWIDSMQRILSQADFVSVLGLFRYSTAAAELLKAMQPFGRMEKDDD